MKLPFNFLHATSDHERLRELKKMCLFTDLSPRELREVDELLHERTYEKDEIIFDEGDIGLGLYIVINGKIKILSSHAGLQQLAPEFCCGEYFGEMALFDEAPRTARAIAAEPSKVVGLFRTEFFSLLQRNQHIASKILF